MLISRETFKESIAVPEYTDALFDKVIDYSISLATTTLESYLRCKFNRDNYTNTYNMSLGGSSINNGVLELLLVTGLVTEVVSVKAGSSITSITEAIEFLPQLAKGIIIVDPLIATNYNFVQVKYTAGFKTLAGVYSNPPAWLTNAALSYAIDIYKSTKQWFTVSDTTTGIKSTVPDQLQPGLSKGLQAILEPYVRFRPMALLALER